MTVRAVLFLVLVFVVSGCASTARDMAREVPQPAINATLRALNEQENQRLMTQLLTSPEVHRAARDFASEVADGTLAALAEPERLARVEEMSSRYVGTLTRIAARSMAEGLRRDLGPAMVGVMRDAVAGTMREVMREGYQRDMERVAAGLTRAAVDAASRGAAEGLRRDVGPAIGEALRDEDTRRSLGALMRVLTREAVLGSNDAVTQAQHSQERSGRPSFLSRVTSITESSARIMELAVAAAVVVALLLGLWVVRLIVRSRKVQAEAERSTASAVLLAEAIRAAEGKPWASELTELLRVKLQRDDAHELIDEVLRSRDTITPKKRDRRAPPLSPLHHGT